MRRDCRWLSLVIAAVLVVLPGCTTSTPPPPLPDPVLNPAGSLTTPVGSIIDFAAVNFAGAVQWTVDTVAGGTPATGTVINGSYLAPVRVPAQPTVTVTATDATNPAKNASADVTITAQGTLYVLNTAVYVYNHLGIVQGNATPNRVFSLTGVGTDYYDMTMAPALDAAFISVVTTSPNVYRVDSVSAAGGTVAGTPFDTLAYEFPSGLAYDPERDILYVVVGRALLAFDGASTAPPGQKPTRIVEGPSLDDLFGDFDSRLSLDPVADRLFISTSEGTISVYDGVSAVDGDIEPDRIFVLDANIVFLWGSAYDASRDELYLGDQAFGVGVYVVADASTAEGLVEPARSIGGAVYSFSEPSQINYDVANDRLVVIDTFDNTIKVFDDASTLDGDVAPSRVIGGTELPIDYPFGGYLDPTQ